MKMLYCRKCGAAMFTDEDLAQNILDRANEASDRARRCPGRYRAAALQEAAMYRSMYKALMHNITSREYAGKVTPVILRALVDEIKSRKLMTDDEIASVYERGKALAHTKQAQIEKEERLIYGHFEAVSNRANSDPTADAAIANLDRKPRRRSR